MLGSRVLFLWLFLPFAVAHAAAPDTPSEIRVAAISLVDTSQECRRLSQAGYRALLRAQGTLAAVNYWRLYTYSKEEWPISHFFSDSLYVLALEREETIWLVAANLRNCAAGWTAHKLSAKDGVRLRRAIRNSVAVDKDDRGGTVLDQTYRIHIHLPGGKKLLKRDIDDHDAPNAKVIKDIMLRGIDWR